LSLESRKNTLDDPGAELLDRASGLWERYGRIVLGVVVGLAVVGISAYYIATGAARKENSASERLTEASDLFWRADYDRSRQLAREINRQYPDTPSGLDALRISGDDAYWRGNWKEAVADYEAYLKKARKGILAAAVRRSLGYAQESLVQYAAAAANFDQVVGQLDRETSGEMLCAAGRCLVGAKQPEEAKKRFQRVLDEFPDTSYQVQARIELGKLSPVYAN
jgi:tetratricopeptide (TPR) repeat protein